MRSTELKTTAADDTATLARLNTEYVRAVDTKDVAWFDQHLTTDFVNSGPDGSLLDRRDFMTLIGHGTGASGLEAHDVIIRVLGDVAIIHARTTYRKPDGEAGRGRYTDIWARRGDDWVCVAAHVTRL